MEKESRKQRIDTLKKQIAANSKDAEWAKKMLHELITLQRQEDVVPMELGVPVSEVKDTADADSFKVIKTTRGYLFQTRGGALSTFVESKYNSVCSMLDTLMYLVKKDKREEFEDSYLDCISYVMQAPIFAAMGLSLPAYNKPAEHDSIFNIGLAILNEFSRFTAKHFTEAEAPAETEEDIKENTIMENAADAIDMMTAEPAQ